MVETLSGTDARALRNNGGRRLEDCRPLDAIQLRKLGIEILGA